MAASLSGEHRLPACLPWQLAKSARFQQRLESKDFAGKLPATTSWQPVVPQKLKRALLRISALC